MQPVADRYIDGAAQADDPKPLGEEFGSLAYELRGPSARYVAHFFNRDERADITKLRARNLALVALYKIPHLPRLISHSIARNTVITTYPAAAIAARLRFLDMAHLLLRVQWQGSLGVEWLRQTAVQLVKAAPEPQCEALRQQSTLAQLPPQH